MRKSYSLKLKLQLCEEKRQGASVEQLANKHRISRGTIFGILENEKNWKDAIHEQKLSLKLKRLRSVTSDEVEQSALEYMEEAHQQQKPVTGDLLSVRLFGASNNY